MKKKELLESLKNRKKDFRFAQFSAIFFFGLVSIGILLSFLNELGKRVAIGEILLIGVLLIPLSVLLMFAGWAGSRYAAEEAEKTQKIIGIADKKTEESLTKEWKNEAGLPLIKAHEDFYVLPGEETYDEIKTNKVFFTEFSALQKRYVPREHSEKKDSVKISVKEELLVALKNKQESVSYSVILPEYIMVACVIMVMGRVLFQVSNIYTIGIPAVIALAVAYPMLSPHRKEWARIQNIKKIIETKTEDQLAKQWLDAEQAPLIKTNEEHYITPEEIGYQEFHSTGHFKTEKEALLALRLPKKQEI